MACEEGCANCHVEGTDGLIADGDGDADAPFVIHPDSGRTIPITVATAAALPTADADHEGMFAWVMDTHLVYECTGTGWMPIGNEWRQTYPGIFTFGEIAGVFENSASSIEVTEGAWKVQGQGYFVGFLDQQDPLSPEYPGPSSVFSAVQYIRAQLWDTTHATLLDETRASVVLWAAQDAAGFVINFGVPGFNIPFHLMNTSLFTEPTTIDLRFARGFGGDPYILAGEYKSFSNDLTADRVAYSDFTT